MAPVWTTTQLSDGTTHSWDLPLAAAWVTRAVGLSQGWNPSIADPNFGAGAQGTAVVNAWQALAYAYMSLNFPPTSDLSAYLPQLRAAYGRSYDGSQPIATGRPSSGSVMQRADAIRVAATGLHFAVDAQYVARVVLSPRAQVVPFCLSRACTVLASAPGITFRWTGSAATNGRPCAGSDDWQCCSWQQIDACLPPLFWSMEIAGRIAGALSSLGVERSIRSSVGAGERLRSYIVQDPSTLSIPDPPGWQRNPAPMPPVTGYGDLSGPPPGPATTPVVGTPPISQVSHPGPAPVAPPAPGSTPQPPAPQTPPPSPAPTPPDMPPVTQPPVQDQTPPPAPGGTPPSPSPTPSSPVDGAAMLARMGLTCATWPSTDAAKADAVAAYLTRTTNDVPSTSDTTAIVQAIDAACSAQRPPPRGVTVAKPDGAQALAAVGLTCDGWRLAGTAARNDVIGGYLARAGFVANHANVGVYYQAIDAYCSSFVGPAQVVPQAASVVGASGGDTVVAVGAFGMLAAIFAYFSRKTADDVSRPK